MKYTALLQFYNLDKEHLMTGDLPDYFSYLSDDISEAHDIPYDNPERYGKFRQIYHIWKTASSQYIGFSFCNIFPDISIEALKKELQKNISIVTIERQIHSQSLRAEYKDRYYDYDICALRRYLNSHDSTLFEHSEEILADNKYYYPTLIIRRDIFQRFCAWLFPILDTCNREIRTKCSLLQDESLEHIGLYLITLFMIHNEEKYKIKATGQYIDLHDGSSAAFQQNISRTESDSISYIQNLIDLGRIEYAIEYTEGIKSDPHYSELKGIFDNYRRQRRHFPLTDLDKDTNIQNLIKLYHTPVPVHNGKPRVLVMVWDSINNDDYIDALKSLGFECETIDTVGGQRRNREYMDRFLNFLDDHKYDLVFSINYFEYISEACYVHDIPYIAWAYDSPTQIGELKYLAYDTTSVFLFDSDETAKYVSLGFKNVYYLPLAVNTDKYDLIKCSPEDKIKYSAQISFVGRLYSTRLTEYLNYLSDYKKGFFNAVLDYATGCYDSYIVEDIFSRDLSSLLDEKPFRNAVYKGEKADKSQPLDDDDMLNSITPRIALLTNATITNRERLILISMLSNHWKFRLFSDAYPELLKKAIYSGTVDYYTEMPKVFKCSDINLNITFKNIKSGIPLRCLDIMGCGGFLLTNYQRDFDEDFTDGRNICIFNSLDEAYEKCSFYLAHDTERKMIAENGYNTVKNKYTYQIQLTKALRRAGLYSLLEGKH